MRINKSDNTLSLMTDVVTPAIRYAYANFVECGIFRNGSNIPSEPFNITVTTLTKSLSSTNSLSLTQTKTLKHGDKLKVAASTPPMGFNHWNFAHCNIDERLVKQIAQFMLDSGLRDAGYEYFNLDDCWYVC